VFEDLRETADGIEAHFADGTHAAGDLLIGADGTRSAVRQRVAPTTSLDYCGYFAWRGLIDERRVPPATLERVAYRMSFSPSPRGHWLGYLVAGPGDVLTPGQRWYNWGWYRQGDEARLRAHLTDATGRHYPLGIPHDRLDPARVAEMRRQAHAELAPTVQRIVEVTAQPYLQAIYELASPRLVYGRTVLIGDAAFTARPHVGLGVSKAADDARTLAAALAESSPAALHGWEDARLRYGRAAVQWGRDLGSYIEAPRDDATHRATADYYRRPEVLLTETASAEPGPYIAARMLPT